ncbi:MAG: DUF421 domain-containing protein [Dyadobacter fermentans]
MKKEDIHFGDWQRMFIGDVPGGFYWEVVLRIAVIYLVLMVSMRLMGKRMASQLSRNEMLAMVSLAAAIGVPLQAPDRGILAAVVIGVVVVAVQQTLAYFAARNQRFESVTQGDMAILVSDGTLDLQKMKVSGITREKAYSQLRNHGIRHLGEVKRLYFEADGSFTLIRHAEVRPGLSIIPGIDAEFVKQVCRPTEVIVCNRCGRELAEGVTSCDNCGGDEQVNAFM